ncbi:unnamed protein product [Prorocentrum cordatum]|uniref:Uncharacterized protein n=1 Tax=Prorocentrum cordatum TaxID=2364126 RepID=A0ABN9V831_9DINO|nr:unnamed protein product [Polarella glacialis]
MLSLSLCRASVICLSPRPTPPCSPCLLGPLGQVLSSAFDQDASEVPNATSTEALVACLPQESCSSFVSQTSAGLELLLKQKRKPARKGLLAIAEAVHALSEAAKVHCGNDARGASVLGDLAVRLVERLKEKAAFEYRRLKVFKVGHVDLRERLNVFVFVWKMCKEAEDARALGKALAELLMFHSKKASEPPSEDDDEL